MMTRHLANQPRCRADMLLGTRHHLVGLAVSYRVAGHWTCWTSVDIEADTVARGGKLRLLDRVDMWTAISLKHIYIVKSRKLIAYVSIIHVQHVPYVLCLGILRLITGHLVDMVDASIAKGYYNTRICQLGCLPITVQRPVMPNTPIAIHGLAQPSTLCSTAIYMSSTLHSCVTLLVQSIQCPPLMMISDVAAPSPAPQNESHLIHG